MEAASARPGVKAGSMRRAMRRALRPPVALAGDTPRHHVPKCGHRQAANTAEAASVEAAGSTLRPEAKCERHRAVNTAEAASAEAAGSVLRPEAKCERRRAVATGAAALARHAPPPEAAVAAPAEVATAVVVAVTAANLFA